MIPLRIVHVLSSDALIWPAGARSLLAWLSEQGHAVAAVPVAEAAAAGVPGLGSYRGWWNWWRRGRRETVIAAANWGCDIVHAHGDEALSPAADLARALRVPLIVELQSLSGSHASRRILRSLPGATIIVPSEYHRAALLARDGGLRERVQVIPPGLALPSMAEESSQEHRPLTIGAWLRRRRDSGVLAKAHAALLGDGLAVRVIAVGELDEDLAPPEPWLSDSPEQCLAACDVFVETSDADLPMPHIVSALAHGRPVIATAVGQLPELVDDGDAGCLVPPQDPLVLAGALRQLAALDRRRACAAHARRCAARHDIAIVGAAVLELYRAAISGQRSLSATRSWRRLSALHLGR